MDNETKRKITPNMGLLGGSAWAAVLGLALLAGCALAEPETPGPKPKAESQPQSQPQAQSQAQPEPQSEAKPTVKPKPKPKGKTITQDKPKPKPKANAKDDSQAKPESGCGSGDKKSAMVDNPEAGWLCEQTTVTKDPIWQGKPLTFAFEIRNEGTADLKIKARGG